MDCLTLKAGPVSISMLAGCRVTARAEKGVAFEPESLAAWAEMVKPGQGALDVGAYTGLYAIAAAKLGAAAYAFEPLREQCDRIEANVELNGVAVHLRRVAISNASGAAQFRFNGRVRLTSGGSLVGKGSDTTTVITRRLDDLDLPPVAAIKIDVERAEDKVISGGLGLIGRCKPQIIAEVLGAESIDAIAKVLPGYRLKRLLDGRNAWLVPV